MRVTLLLLASILILADSSSSSIITPAPPLKAKGSDSLFRIQEKDKWGYMDRDGVVVIGPRFESAGDFFEGLAVASRDGVVGYIDSTGEWSLRPSKGYLGNFSGGTALFIGVDESGLHETGRGLIDRGGHFVLSPRFDHMGLFSEGLAVASEGEKLGFVATSGNVAIPFQFDGAKEFSEGLAPVAVASERDAVGKRSSLKWGFIDHHGNLVIPTRFDDVSPFHSGAAIYRDVVAQKAGLVDRTGEVIQEARYSDIGSHEADTGSDGGLFKAWIGGNDYDYLRPDGSVVFNVEGQTIDRFSEGRARISQQGKFGFLNGSGSTAIPLTLEDAGNFSEGVAAAKRERWGYIDQSGVWVIPPQFEGAMEFRDGLALVRLGLSWHYIDKQGRMVRPTAWTYPPCVLPDPRWIELRPMLCGY